MFGGSRKFIPMKSMNSSPLLDGGRKKSFKDGWKKVKWGWLMNNVS